MKKKVIIGTIIIILVIAVSVLTTLLVIKNMSSDEDENDTSYVQDTLGEPIEYEREKIDEKDKAKYEKIAKEYIEAVKNGKNMNEFISEYVDFEAHYVRDLAFERRMTPDELYAAYKDKAKYAEEEEKEFIKSANSFYQRFIHYSAYDVDLELEDVEFYKDTWICEDGANMEAKYKNKGGQEIIYIFDFAGDKIYDASISGDLNGVKTYMYTPQLQYYIDENEDFTEKR